MYNPTEHTTIQGQETFSPDPPYPPFFPGQGGGQPMSGTRTPGGPPGRPPQMPMGVPPTSMPGGNNAGMGGAMPLSPPPQNPPARTNMARAVDSGSIRNCIGRFTYIWLDNGNEFWMYPLQVGRNSVSGFRWNRNFGWVYFGVALNRIDFFTCI